jgi:GNAT superfamily N-acetyltransferase
VPVRVAAEHTLDRDEIVDLYASVGWNAYTADPDQLMRALAGSHLVLTARDDTGALVGLARTISDGETVCYVQDILVRPDAQRHGVGRALMDELHQCYAHCRAFVLTTDSSGGAADFYRTVGLVPHAERDLTAFGRP